MSIHSTFTTLQWRIVITICQLLVRLFFFFFFFFPPASTDSLLIQYRSTIIRSLDRHSSAHFQDTYDILLRGQPGGRFLSSFCCLHFTFALRYRGKDIGSLLQGKGCISECQILSRYRGLTLFHRLRTWRFHLSLTRPLSPSFRIQIAIHVFSNDAAVYSLSYFYEIRQSKEWFYLFYLLLRKVGVG